MNTINWINSDFMSTIFFVGSLALLGKVAPEKQMRYLIKMVDKGDKNGFNQKFREVLSQDLPIQDKINGLKEVMEKYIKP